MACSRTRILLLLALAWAIGPLSPAQFGGSAGIDAASPHLAGLPLAFIANHGQFDDATRFQARWGGVTAFAQDRGMRLAMISAASRQEAVRQGVNLTLRFVGARAGSIVRGIAPLETRFNYFLGDHPADWHIDVPAFRSIEWGEVWDGIGIVMHDDAGRLEYDLVVRAGGNLDHAVIDVEGANDLTIDDGGDLVIRTTAGDLRQRRPRAWLRDERGALEPVACQFRLAGPRSFGFLAPVDPSRTLVVDPTIVWGAYLGGANFDSGFAITVNAAGNAFVGGRTASSNFPVTAGAFDTSKNGAEDAFVAKVAPSGGSLVWATYLGGSGLDYVNAIAVDANNQVYVAGSCSTGYPTPVGFDTSYNGNSDAMVTKLNANGNGIIFSTFLGGSQAEIATGIYQDASGVYACGTTQSLANFPFQPGSYQSPATGDWDGFVAKLNPAGTSLLFCARLGGSAFDAVNGIAADASGHAYVAASVSTAELVTTPGAFQAASGGGADVYIAKLTPAGDALMYATYLGGPGSESATSVALGAAGELYVAGQAFAGFPTTPGAFQQLNLGGDGFITRLNAAGTNLVFSTFIGGTSVDQLASIAVDPYGAVYAAGWTSSPDFPLTHSAFNTTYLGGGTPGDAVVVKLAPDGHALTFSSLIAGGASDQCRAIAVDPAGAIYVTGVTDSTDLTVPAGSFSPTARGQSDGFVIKLSVPLNAAMTAIGAGCGAAPVLTSSLPILGQTLTINLAQAAPNATGFLLVSAVPFSATSVGPGCTTILDLTSALPIYSIAADQAGNWSATTGILPESEVMIGLRLRAQAVLPTMGGPLGFVLSTGLEWHASY